jgi:Transposase IS66 family
MASSCRETAPGRRFRTCSAERPRPARSPPPCGRPRLPRPALAAITRHLIPAEIVHLDETGFGTSGKLAWVHSASQGKFALFTVQAGRGKDGMEVAGVLPHFCGIAVHDAWAPYDTTKAPASPSQNRGLGRSSDLTMRIRRGRARVRAWSYRKAPLRQKRGRT